MTKKVRNDDLAVSFLCVIARGKAPKQSDLPEGRDCLEDDTTTLQGHNEGHCERSEAIPELTLSCWGKKVRLLRRRIYDLAVTRQGSLRGAKRRSSLMRLLRQTKKRGSQ